MAALQSATDIAASGQSAYVQAVLTLNKLESAYDPNNVDAPVFDTAIKMMRKKVQDLFKDITGQTEHLDLMQTTADELEASISKPTMVMRTQLKDLDDAFKAGLIPLDDYKVGINQIAQSYANAAYYAKSLSVYNPETGAKETYGGDVANEEGSTFGGFTPAQSYISNSDSGMFAEYNKAQEETELLEEEYAKRRETILASSETTELERQELLGTLQEQYLRARETYTSQENQTYMQGVADMGGTFASGLSSMATSLKTLGGESSGAYKAMFVASQVAAAAMAGVNAWLSYSQVMADPTIPYAVKPVLASTALAAGMLSVAAIIGTTIASFEGGGATGSGPRIGGVDGHGGKLAVLHPDEKVLDLTKDDMKDSAGSSSAEININNYTDATVDVRQRKEGSRQYTDFIISQVKDSIAQDIMTGNGCVSTAFGLSYKSLQRGT